MCLRFPTALRLRVRPRTVANLRDTPVWSALRWALFPVIAVHFQDPPASRSIALRLMFTHAQTILLHHCFHPLHLNDTKGSFCGQASFRSALADHLRSMAPHLSSGTNGTICLFCVLMLPAHRNAPEQPSSYSLFGRHPLRLSQLLQTTYWTYTITVVYCRASFFELPSLFRTA